MENILKSDLFAYTSSIRIDHLWQLNIFSEWINMKMMHDALSVVECRFAVAVEHFLLNPCHRWKTFCHFHEIQSTERKHSHTLSFLCQ